MLNQYSVVRDRYSAKLEDLKLKTEDKNGEDWSFLLKLVNYNPI